LKSSRSFYYLIWVVVLLAILALRNLLDSRQGRAIRALKGGTVMAEAMGVNTPQVKIVIFLRSPRCSPAFPAGSTRICSASLTRHRSG
jgi:ABC-type branched-subunit amino acid transport system permease subunit